MSNLPEDLKYQSSHEWIRHDGDGVFSVGITDHAQNALGDVVFVELPSLKVVEIGESVAVVESVKAASDIYSPVAGEIIEINPKLGDSPELVNHAPYESWFFKIRVPRSADMNHLLNAQAYQDLIEK